MKLKSGTFVALGNMNLPFTRLINIVLDSIEFLPKPIVIQGRKIVRDRVVNENVYFVDQLSFSEYDYQIECAEVIISHGGVGTIWKTLQAGKKPIVMSRLKIYNEHINDHQVELVNYLNETYDALFVISSKFELVTILQDKSYKIQSNCMEIPLFSNNKIVADIRKYLELQF